MGNGAHQHKPLLQHCTKLNVWLQECRQQSCFPSAGKPVALKLSGRNPLNPVSDILHCLKPLGEMWCTWDRWPICATRWANQKDALSLSSPMAPVNPTTPAGLSSHSERRASGKPGIRGRFKPMPMCIKDLIHTLPCWTRFKGEHLLQILGKDRILPFKKRSMRWKWEGHSLFFSHYSLHTSALIGFSFLLRWLSSPGSTGKVYFKKQNLKGHKYWVVFPVENTEPLNLTLSHPKRAVDF